MLVQKLAVTVAGFAAGAVGFIWITEQLGWSVGLPTLVGALVVGLIAAALVRWRVDLTTMRRRH